jgi:ferredoxin--NADP+ reductase
MAQTASSVEVAVNTYRPNEPFVGKAVKVDRLTPDDSPNDVRHIVLDLSQGNLNYVEGQSIGIIPTGTQASGKPHKLRLYSIASTRTGDEGGARSVSLCVKRVVYRNDSGETIKGVASNYLCDLEEGQDVMITGPVGKNFLLPEDPTANLVLIATGTGIAPFRAFLIHIFQELAQPWTGEVHLFFGVQTSTDVLYEDLYEELKAKHPNFHIHLAKSREEKTADGQKMYVQGRIAEKADTLWDLMDKGNTFTFICGLRGMEDGIDAVYSPLAAKHGKNWPTMQSELKRAGFWHVETY